MNLDKKTFTKLKELTLAEIGILERKYLQEMVCNSFSAFTAELECGELLFIGQEVKPSDEVDVRIDVLALNKQAQPVIFELKRDKDKDQLRQILTYGSMIADWKLPEFVKQLVDSRQANNLQEAEEMIGDFVEIDIEDEIEKFNCTQQLVLVAEAFVPEVASTVRWLHQQHGVELHCYIVEAPNEESLKYLSFQRAYPPRGFEEQRPKPRQGTTLPAKTRDEILQGLENKELADFVRSEEGAGIRSGGPKRLYYSVGEVVRFNFNITRKWATIWQISRFRDDRNFWSKLLGNEAEVREVNSGASLSFKLITTEHFTKFKNAVEKEIQPGWFNV